jgi:hypothetical protein
VWLRLVGCAPYRKCLVSRHPPIRSGQQMLLKGRNFRLFNFRLSGAEKSGRICYPSNHPILVCLDVINSPSPLHSLHNNTRIMPPQRTPPLRARRYATPDELKPSENQSHLTTPQRTAIIVYKLIAQKTGEPIHSSIVQQVSSAPPRTQSRVLASGQVR